MDKEDIEKAIDETRKHLNKEMPIEFSKKAHELFKRIESQYDDIIGLMKRLKKIDENIGRRFMSATIKAMLIDFSKDIDEMLTVLNYVKQDLVRMETEFNKKKNGNVGNGGKQDGNRF
jgi:hypothetical protein